MWDKNEVRKLSGETTDTCHHLWFSHTKSDSTYRETFKLEAMNQDELNAPDLPFVTIENIYFEITPAKLITGWINEDEVVKIKPN